MHAIFLILQLVHDTGHQPTLELWYVLHACFPLWHTHVINDSNNKLLVLVSRSIVCVFYIPYLMSCYSIYRIRVSIYRSLQLYHTVVRAHNRMHLQIGNEPHRSEHTL